MTTPTWTTIAISSARNGRQSASSTVDWPRSRPVWTNVLPDRSLQQVLDDPFEKIGESPGLHNRGEDTDDQSGNEDDQRVFGSGLSGFGATQETLQRAPPVSYRHGSRRVLATSLHVWVKGSGSIH